MNETFLIGIWEKGINWNQELINDFKGKCLEWGLEILRLEEVNIRKNVYWCILVKELRILNYRFCNASLIAYGSVKIFHYQNNCRHIRASFMLKN